MADFSTPLPQATAAAAQDAPAGSWFATALSKDAWLGTLGRVKVLSRSFFRLSEFSKPESQADWLHRVSVNAHTYKVMYSLVLLPVLVYTMLSSMWLRIGTVVLVALWGYAFMYKNGEVPLSCFGFEFKAREKLYVLVPASIIVGLVTGMLNALISAAIIFALVTLPHMSFHAPASFDALDALELQTLSGSAS